MTTHTLGLEHCASFAKQAGSGAHLRHKEKEGFLHRQTRGWRMVSFLLLYLAPICSFDKLADTKCLFKGIVHPRWYTVIVYTLVSFQTCMTFKCGTQKIFWKMPLCFLSMQWKSVGSKCVGPYWLSINALREKKVQKLSLGWFTFKQYTFVPNLPIKKSILGS